MASLRVLFLFVIIVTVVSITNGDSKDKKTSKMSHVKHHIKDKGAKLGKKFKGLTGKFSQSPHAQKAKDWGKSAHYKIKVVADKHPKIKNKAGKAYSKVKGLKKSASEKKKKAHTKARSLSNDYRAKAISAKNTVEKEYNRIRKFIRNAKAISAVNSKVTGLRKSLTNKRGVDNVAKVKNAVRSGTDKLGSLKESSKSGLSKIKDKTLTSLKESAAIKKLQSKLPASSLDKLKKMPGADKLKGLATSNVAKTESDKGSSLKSKLSSIRSLALEKAGSFKEKHL